MNKPKNLITITMLFFFWNHNEVQYVVKIQLNVRILGKGRQRVVFFFSVHI